MAIMVVPVRDLISCNCGALISFLTYFQLHKHLSLCCFPLVPIAGSSSPAYVVPFLLFATNKPFFLDATALLWPRGGLRALNLITKRPQNVPEAH